MAEKPGPLVYLIRHARPSAAWGDGAEDPGLDEMGATQARLAADQLAVLPYAERPHLIVSSPMRRCLETARPLADALGLTVRINPLVGEIPTPGRLAPAERPDWLARAMAGRWSEIDGDLDYDAWRKDVVAAVGRRAQVAIFTHFVAINAVVSQITRTDRVIGFHPGHASITTLALEASGLRLISLGAEATTGVL